MNDADLTTICGLVTRGTRLTTACELVGVSIEELFDSIDSNVADLTSVFSAMLGTAYLASSHPPGIEEDQAE